MGHRLMGYRVCHTEGRVLARSFFVGFQRRSYVKGSTDQEALCVQLANVADFDAFFAPGVRFAAFCTRRECWRRACVG